MIMENKKNHLSLNIIIIIAIIVVLMMSYIIMRLSHKPSYDWWYSPNLNNGIGKIQNGNKYSEVFSISQMFAWQSSTTLFYIFRFLSTPESQLSSSAYRFLFKNILPYSIHTIDHQSFGILTPKSLCESVLLTQNDGDYKYDDWYNAKSTKGIEGYKRVRDGTIMVDTKNLNTVSHYTATVKKHNYKYYVRADNDDSMTNGLYTEVGMWPSPHNQLFWAAVILDWLNYDEDGYGQHMINNYVPNNSWVLEGTTDGIPLYPTWYSTDNSSPNLSNWYKRPDNFLGRMRIPYDCPLVIYFMNNLYNIRGLHVDPDGFSNLIGSGTAVAGGWVGFCHGMEKSEADDLESYIKAYVQHDVPVPPPKPICRKKPNWLSGILAGLLSFIGIGVFAVGAPEAAIPVLVAGAGAGAISGYQAAKPTC